LYTVATKVDNTTLDHVKDKCNGLGCTPAEYFRNLIKKDLESGNNAVNNDKGTVLAGQSPIPHKSHPDIKIIRSVEKNGRMYYFDIEGKKYSMKQDGTLIPIITIIL